MRPLSTPSQTVGPYFTMRLACEGENVLVTPETAGRRIRVEGRVLDGDRKHIEDALIELWQADAVGRYATDAFAGFGRCASDFTTGGYSFHTVKPGPVRFPDGGMQAPHLTLTIQARGMLNPTFTRVYFADEAVANEADPVLAMVPPDRRRTLIAALVATDGVPTYQFDIRYQGTDETVFFDL